MRLRVTIHRHGIPPAQVLWTVAPIRPPLASAGSSITISQFLEQVNDIIPLESEDWGLEDYAVEVRGFECLHFSELGQVLKEDDEVCIRPLQTTDLRIRRISGRHQISADGKHLIDGIAFGRPFLRRADRPAVKIPPRKRRRILYDEEDEIWDGEAANNKQVIVRAGFDNGDKATAEEQSDDEDDFVPRDGENEEDLGAELADLQDDLQSGAGEEHQNTNKAVIRRPRRSPKGLGLLAPLEEKGRLLNQKYNNSVLDTLEEDKSQRARHRPKRRKIDSVSSAGPALRRRKNENTNMFGRLQQTERRDSVGSNKSVRFEDSESATPATIREAELSEEDDDDFEPGNIDESDKENAEPLSDADSEDELSESSQSSSSTVSEQVDDDETSSSGSSSSDSSSDSDSDSEAESDSESAPEKLPSRAQVSKPADSETSSSGSSSSSSESEVEAQPQRHYRPYNYKGNPVPFPTKPITKLVPPGAGKRSTQMRNRRRRQQKRLVYLREEGFLPPEATISDLHAFEGGGLTTISQDHGVPQPADEDGLAHEDALDAKRKMLLSSISSGGFDVAAKKDLPVQDLGATDEPQRAKEEGKATVNNQPDEGGLAFSESPPVVSNPNVEPTKHNKEIGTPKDNDTLAGAEVPDTSKESPSIPMEAKDSSPQQRRSKLDLSGAKRMLFGSLGLKTPKSKEDESTTREKLMKNAKPMIESRRDPQSEKAEDLALVATDDSWKEKIDLRAVECCHEGVQLSTPPFPFVQRWDPQQRGGYFSNSSRKRKNKKRKRRNDSFYEENNYEDVQEEAPYHQGQDASNNESSRMIEEAQVDTEMQSNSLKEDFQNAANEQLSREYEDVSTATLAGMDAVDEDLPEVPEDPTTCPPLTREAATKGTIIAFKQLEMSAETNWQPHISEYRTAIVNDFTDKGDMQMTPAKRDRVNKVFQYDDKTGERIYDKFEMPDYSDGDDSDKLEISFDELINPILIRAAIDASAQLHVEQDKSLNHAAEQGAKAGNLQSTELSEPQDEQSSKDPSGPAEKDERTQITDPSEANREEISELIRDAGWRSSVHSDVNGSLHAPGDNPRDDQLHDQEDNREDTTLIDAPSPHFNGFGSSPLVNVRSSPPVAEQQDPKRSYASDTEIADSVPLQNLDGMDERSESSRAKSAVRYPDLPQVGDDSELLQEEAQQRSDPPFDQQVLSQEFTSNTLPSEGDSQSRNIDPVDSAESTDEFPEPFSQAWEDRLSQDVDSRRHTSLGAIVSPPSRKKHNPKVKLESSQRESNQTWRPEFDTSELAEDDDDDHSSTPRPSQMQVSSQIVDLTMSSDPVASQDDYRENGDEDSYKLPKGPGWVKKPRARKRRTGDWGD